MKPKKIMKRKKPAKAIFRIKVDFNDEYRKQYGELSEGQSYYLPSFSKQEKKTSYEDIKNFMTDIIEDDLRKHLSKTFGTQILEIRVTADYPGSIELVFIVLFNAYQFVAGLKDFYDNIRLIQNYSSKYIEQRLNDKYGDAFNTSTYIEYPTINHYDEFFWMFEKRGMPPFFHNSENLNNRDGLFYYLLVSNIVLITIIGLLIFRAVKSYYGF